MVRVKITVTAADKRKYISVDVPSEGATELGYDVGNVFNQAKIANFPAFNGTEAEWLVILNTATNIEIKNLGK